MTRKEHGSKAEWPQRTQSRGSTGPLQPPCLAWSSRRKETPAFEQSSQPAGPTRLSQGPLWNAYIWVHRPCFFFPVSRGRKDRISTIFYIIREGHPQLQYIQTWPHTCPRPWIWKSSSSQAEYFPQQRTLVNNSLGQWATWYRWMHARVSGLMLWKLYSHLWFHL